MLYYKATAGFGVRVFVGVSVQKRTHRPRFSHPGSCSGVAPLLLSTAPAPAPPVARSLAPSVLSSHHQL